MSEETTFRNISYFKIQFPHGDHRESFVVKPYSEKLTDFKSCNLDIGWALNKGTKKNADTCPTRHKNCLGAVYCSNNSCILFEKEMRPKYTLQLIKIQEWTQCGELITHKRCSVSVKFTLVFSEYLKKNTCYVDCKGLHSHGDYSRIHLSGEEEKYFIEKVKSDPYTTPKKLRTGLTSRSGESVQQSHEINELLLNQDRVKHQLNSARSFLGIERSADFLGDFMKVMKEYEGYIVHAQVATDKDSIIAFAGPDMMKYKLPFDKQLIVTDVTYGAVADPKKYLCSSVIFVPEMQKSVVFFQAIIGSLEARAFAAYFIQMFQHIKLNKHPFLGMMMDFSAAQRLVFIHAFNYYYHNNAEGSGTDEQVEDAFI